MQIPKITLLAGLIAGALLAGGASGALETYTTNTWLLGYHKAACFKPDYEACSSATTHWDTNEVSYSARNGRVLQGFDRISPAALRGDVLDTSWTHFYASRYSYYTGSGTWRCGTFYWDGGDSNLAWGSCYP
jgi:hypothetical protein